MMFHNYIITFISPPSAGILRARSCLIAHWIVPGRRGHSSESRLSLIFSGFTFETVLLCIHNCDDLECLRYKFFSRNSIMLLFMFYIIFYQYYRRNLYLFRLVSTRPKRAIRDRALTNRSREQSSVWVQINLLLHNKHCNRKSFSKTRPSKNSYFTCRVL